MENFAVGMAFYVWRKRKSRMELAELENGALKRVVVLVWEMRVKMTTGSNTDGGGIRRNGSLVLCRQ